MRLTPGLDFDRSGHTEVPVASWAEPTVCRYFYRLRSDELVHEFCVQGAIGPHSVETYAADGSLHKWPSFQDGDLLVFYPPDSYAGAQLLLWAYDRRLNRGEPLERPALERAALNQRVSITVP
jgi:hypothetical protein